MFHNSKQAEFSQNSRAAESVDDFVRQESSNLSGLKNSKSSSQFHRLPEIHRHLIVPGGLYSNNLKQMNDEELKSSDSKQLLDSFTVEQGLIASFIDFEELSISGKYQTALQISTPITLVFHGESINNYEEAQQQAAWRSLDFFKCLLNSKALNPGTSS